MNRDQVIRILSEHSVELARKFRVKSLALFGSVSRDEAEPSSDVDLLVEFEPTAQIGMFEFARLRRQLSHILGCKVDLATLGSLHKSLKDNILRESIRAA